ncbi:MAG TPA: endonuclease/exonuclease/phosphatase family protein [Usitatibacter sp.]|jgi:endonuclease/exonuclease/phosphatase family metal-dependent hydrolase|nr:endonuclease/exonuclease/phosphatase family protein [Usitatibacter sp.]
MRLVTWNIQWGRGIDDRVDLARIVETARRLADFDVLCVQEVADNFPALEGNDERDQFAELGRLLPGYARIQGYGVDLPGDDGRRRRFGNAIFSRYRVVAARRHALPWPAEPRVDTMPRVAVEATVEAPMGAIRITTTHLEYYSDVQREAQARRLRELHEEACERAVRPGPRTRAGGPFDPTPQTPLAILVGDFNAPPDSAAYDQIQAPIAQGLPRYRDAWRIAKGHQPHAPTFCVHQHKYSKTPYCCDFAFVSEPLAERVRALRIDSETQASDHQPVFIEIDDI